MSGAVSRQSTATQEHTHDLLLKDVVLPHHIVDYLPAIFVDNENFPLPLVRRIHNAGRLTSPGAELRIALSMTTQLAWPLASGRLTVSLYLNDGQIHDCEQSVLIPGWFNLDWYA
jgi:hypothetical protein